MMKTTKIFLAIAICLFVKPSFSKEGAGLILLIGDGMGTNQIALLEEFINSSEIAKKKKIKNGFARLRAVKADQRFFGLSRTGTPSTIAVDSACSATQLATGKPSLPEVLGLDEKGNPVNSILMKAQRAGYLTGVITDTRVTHATPAAFYAHLPFRWMEDEIAEELIRTAPDLVMGGGLNRFVPASFQGKQLGAVVVNSKRKDEKNLIAMAERKNYQFISSKKQLKNVKAKKVLALFTDHSYPDAFSLEERGEAKRDVPRLSEMASFGLKFLQEKAKKDQGFFLMIEGGQIDWSAHKNDVGGVLREMLRFNEMLNKVIDFLEENPQHNLVVTADHETGGFSMGYNYLDIPKGRNIKGKFFAKNKYKAQFNYVPLSTMDKLYAQDRSLDTIWAEYQKQKSDKDDSQLLAKLVFEGTGIKLKASELEQVFETRKNDHQHKWHLSLSVAEMPKINDMREYYYHAPNTLVASIGRKLAPKQFVMWATGGHSFAPVSVYAMGPGAKKLREANVSDHIRLGQLMQEILGL